MLYIPAFKRFLGHFLLLLVFSCLAVGITTRGQKLPEHDPRVTPTVKAVAKVLPSVVNLSSEKMLSRGYSHWGNDPFESLFNEFLNQQPQQSSVSLGSGSIIDPSGLVVTNAHVVHRAARIHVTLPDGRKFLAQEVASDDLNDLALLQIMGLKPGGGELPAIGVASPGDLYLGETVIAVGNPYGLGSSISKGVLSAKERKVTFQGQVIFSDILQTDAPIYPGNSGGPLININGNMIGINTAIHREGKGGIGFAIPLQRVENVLAKWLIPERSTSLSLGIIPAVRVDKVGAPEIYLADVIAGSPAAKAGMKKGTIIESMDGRKLDNLMVLSCRLWHLAKGQKLKLGLNSGQTVQLVGEPMAVKDGATLAHDRLGIGVQELTKSLAEALGYPFEGGVIVSDITNGNGTVKRGDLLARIGDVAIYQVSDIAKALRDKHYGDNVEALVISVIQRAGRFYLVKKRAVFKIK